MRSRVLRSIAAATLREFMRTPEALFWTYGFPLVMAIVLGLAFHEKQPDPVRIGAIGDALVQALRANERLVVEPLAAERARSAIAKGEIELLVEGTPDAPRITIDPTRPQAELARLHVERALQRHAGAREPVRIEERIEAQPGHRYIDFLIPGLIGLNLLGAGLWGIGYTLVDMRGKKLMKRLLVTPMGKAEFLLAFLGSRLLLAIPESFVILAFGVLVFGVPVLGSWLGIASLTIACAFAMKGLGVLVAARPRTVEGVTGWMNLVQLPMWLLGGSFFSNSHFPGWLQPLVKALPLTQYNDAMRELMRGGPASAALFAIAYLCGFALACFVIAVRCFRWT